MNELQLNLGKPRFFNEYQMMRRYFVFCIFTENDYNVFLIKVISCIC